MLSVRRVCQADAKLITGKLNKYFTNEALTYFCINFILLSIVIYFTNGYTNSKFKMGPNSTGSANRSSV